MMNKLLEIFLVSVLPALITSGLVTLILQERQRRKSERWNMKREACLEALDTADAILSNIDWPDFRGVMDIEEVDTIKVRKIYNKVATCCDSKDLLEVFRKIIFQKDINLSIIVDMRNVIRKELGFKSKIDLDRKNAYFVRIFPKK